MLDDLLTETGDLENKKEHFKEKNIVYSAYIYILKIIISNEFEMERYYSIYTPIDAVSRMIVTATFRKANAMKARTQTDGVCIVISSVQTDSCLDRYKGEKTRL